MQQTKTATNGQARTTNNKPVVVPEWCRKMFPGVLAPLKTVCVGEVTVTPEVSAKVIAERMGRQRPMNKAQLRRLKRAMLHGLFRVTGDTIVFSDEGKVINGQHRFHAIIESGVAIETLIVFGVSSDCFRVYDQQTNRNLGQLLAMEGEEHATILSAFVSRLTAFFVSGSLAQGRTGPVDYTIEELMNLRHDYNNMTDSLAFALSIKKDNRKKLRGEANIALLHWVFSRVDRPLAEQFLTALCDSTVPTEERWHPVKLLASKLQPNVGRQKLTRGYTECFTVKVWNALRENRSLERLGWKDDESFPQVSGWTYMDGKPIEQ